MHDARERAIRLGFHLRVLVSVCTMAGVVGMKRAGLISADLFPVLVVTFICIFLNIPYALIYDRCGRRNAQIASYVAVDVLFITAVAHYLGGIDAFYAVYGYLIIIFFCHFYLTRAIAILLTGISALSYLGLVALEVTGVIPHHPTVLDLYAMQPWAQWLLAAANVLAMVLISSYAGLVAGKIEQKTAALVQATRVIADQNRSLEHEVEKRTAELENKNRKLEETLLSLQETRERLYIKERMSELGKLVADAAHAMKTPLAVIQLRVGLLAQKLPGDEAIREDVRAIDQQARGLQEFVSNLLNLYGPGTLSRRSVNLNNLLEITLSLIGEKGTLSSRVQVRRSYDEGLPVMEADFHQLQHAFLNILVNALESMPGGGILTLETRRDRDHVLVSIADTGCSVPPEDLARIFQPFYTTKQGHSGVGLGLAIAGKVVERHGGSIEVQSEPAGGTRFVVRIPLGRAQAPPPRAEQRNRGCTTPGS